MAPRHIYALALVTGICLSLDFEVTTSRRRLLLFVVRMNPYDVDAIFVVRRSERVGMCLTPWLFVGRFTHLSVLDFRVVVVRPAYDTI